MQGGRAKKGSGQIKQPHVKQNTSKRSSWKEVHTDKLQEHARVDPHSNRKTLVQYGAAFILSSPMLQAPLPPSPKILLLY